MSILSIARNGRGRRFKYLVVRKRKFLVPVILAAVFLQEFAVLRFFPRRMISGDVFQARKNEVVLFTLTGIKPFASTDEHRGDVEYQTFFEGGDLSVVFNYVAFSQKTIRSFDATKPLSKSGILGVVSYGRVRELNKECSVTVGFRADRFIYKEPLIHLYRPKGADNYLSMRIEGADLTALITLPPECVRKLELDESWSVGFRGPKSHEVHMTSGSVISYEVLGEQPWKLTMPARALEILDGWGDSAPLFRLRGGEGQHLTMRLTGRGSDDLYRVLEGEGEAIGTKGVYNWLLNRSVFASLLLISNIGLVIFVSWLFKARLQVFICYRRKESQQVANRVYAALCDELGASRCFLDKEELQVGEEWLARIKEEISASDIFLALIGEQWLEAGDGSKEDPVCVEIETALEAGTPVLPVLVDGADMPTPGELPRSIQGILDKHIVEIRTGHRDFQRDIQDLIAALYNPESRRQEDQGDPRELERSKT